MVKIVELPPIRETTEDFEALEKRLKLHFRERIYLPLLATLGEKKRALLKNERDELIAAIQDHQIFFHQGAFRGKFTAAISRELKELGAIWDRKTASWKIRQDDLPMGLRASIASTEFRFKQKLIKIDQKLSQIAPEEIADSFRASDLFDRALWKTDKEFHHTLKELTLAPHLSPRQRKRIATEWQNNLQLDIKTFAEKEIQSLRTELMQSIFAGNRQETAVKAIQDSYGVSLNKARFLARQETSLLMTKFKETRYEDAGVKEYRWGCVAGSKAHPVRPSHKALEGKIFRWDTPPITTMPGEPQRRNNPGQDFFCRCFARPIVRFSI